MVELRDNEMPETERIASDANRRHEAWGATPDNMIAMASEFEDEGWETVRIPAGDSGPFDSSSGKGGEGAFGFAYIIPDDKAETAADPFEATSFPEYEVRCAENDGRVHIVTALFLPETETATFTADVWDLHEALECTTVVVEEGRVYFHLQKLDDIVVGVAEHDDPKKFFPNLDAIRWYAPNSNDEGEGDGN